MRTANPLKDGMKIKAHSKFYRLVKGSLVLIAFANKESLKIRDVDEGTHRICEQRKTR